MRYSASMSNPSTDHRERHSNDLLVRHAKGLAMTDMPDEEITPYDGATELDEDGELQPRADAPEDPDPEAYAGEELPDEEDAP
jgi:hypothetical protein